MGGVANRPTNFPQTAFARDGRTLDQRNLKHNPAAVIVLYLVYLANDYAILIKPMALRSLARRVASDKLIENPKIKRTEAVIAILETILTEITIKIPPPPTKPLRGTVERAFE